MDNFKTPVLKAFLTSPTNFVYSPILMCDIQLPIDPFKILFVANDLEVEAALRLEACEALAEQ